VALKEAPASSYLYKPTHLSVLVVFMLLRLKLTTF